MKITGKLISLVVSSRCKILVVADTTKRYKRLYIKGLNRFL